MFIKRGTSGEYRTRTGNPLFKTILNNINMDHDKLMDYIGCWIITISAITLVITSILFILILNNKL